MKKSIISIILSVLMATCVFAFVGCDNDDTTKHSHVYTVQAGYSVKDGKAYESKKCSCGKVSETEMTDYIIATAETAQDVLDGKEGSLDGKTIVFAAGEYDSELYLGRPTGYADSNTVYRGLQNSTVIESIEEIGAMTWGSKYYTRSIENLTVVAEAGAVLPAITAISGHYHGSGYDYVLDREFSGSGYFLTHIFENITFKGVAFAGKIDFETSQEATEVGGEIFQSATSIDGLNFLNCSFTLDGITEDKGAALRVYSENGTDNTRIKNVVVDGCDFNNVYQGVYTHHVQNVTVKNCSFDTTGHNAIAIQSHGDIPFNHGNIVITDNEFKNVGDRIIRFNAFAGTSVTITGNEAVDCGDEDKEVIKATSLADGVEYVISDNDWGDGRTVYNEQLRDAE